MIYYDHNNKLQANYMERIISQNKTFDDKLGYGLDKTYTRLDKQKLIDWLKHWCGYGKYLWQNSSGNDIKISVITLIYNANKSWLLQSIFSSLWQITSFKYKLELVFVCDPPWTEEKEWLDEISLKYPDIDFIIILNNKPIGYAGSYNLALDNTSGDYIFILDCDDISHPERFEWSVKLLDDNTDLMGVSFIPLAFKYQYDFFNICRIESGRPAILNSAIHTLLDATLLRHPDNRPFMRINPQTICYRKDIAKNIRIEPEYCLLDNSIPQMDRLFLMHCLAKYPLGFMQNDRCLVFHRMHDNQACGRKCKFNKDYSVEIKMISEMSDKIISGLNKDTIDILINNKNKLLQDLK